MGKTVAEKEAVKAEKEAVKASRSSATVTWRGGVRTYTREVHGEDFAELAKEFAEKKDGVIA